MASSELRKAFIVCEGQTEEIFVHSVVAPHFYSLGIQLIAQLIETSPGHKGGALQYDRVSRHLRNTLRQSNQSVVTTLFDLYKLNTSFPGYEKAKTKSRDDKLKMLTEALHADIIAQTNCRPDRFIPYIQPYEFESLLFSEPKTIAQAEPEWLKMEATLTAKRQGAETPEHINDGSTPHPSAILATVTSNPSYKKTLHGPVIAEKIGLAKIEKECPIFCQWINRLRTI